MAKIGILGGTFNPIHNGHIALAKAAYDSLALDKVLIMPTGISYLKKDIIVLPKDIRAHMTRLAIEGISYFEFSDIELNREGNTYTYETLEALHQLNLNDEYYFITGADTVFNIEYWKYPERILSNCILAVMVRDEVSITDLSIQCEYLKNKYNAKFELINSPKIDISSSDIRNKIYSGQLLSVKDMLPEKVFNYIAENNLYM